MNAKLLLRETNEIVHYLYKHMRDFGVENYLI